MSATTATTATNESNNYLEKVFLVETRLQQLNNLRHIVVEKVLLDDFEEILNEMKDILVFFKCNLMNGNYVFIPFKPPSYEFRGGEMTPEIVDKMVFILYQSLVREFDMTEYYDQEGCQTLIDNILNDCLPSYSRYLKSTISPAYFSIWKSKRDGKFTPEKTVEFLEKNELFCLSKDICGICLENHVKKDVITCKCFHEFGHNCFNEWKNICQDNSRVLSCPTCRQDVKEITCYEELV